MRSRFVIGDGAMLDIAVDAWTLAQPTEHIVRIEISQGPDYGFDLSPLDSVDRGAEAFIAFDERFGNFSRLELFQAAVERGFRMSPCVSSRAMLASNVKIGPNTFVGDGAVIGAGVVCEHNSVVHAGAFVGTNVHIKSSCWIESGVVVKHGAAIGANSTLRSGVIVGEGVTIGRCCEIGLPGSYRDNVASKTIFHQLYDQPIKVFGD